MKVSWWQTGLHVEPENPEEHRALALIDDSVRKTSIGEENRLARESSDISGALKEIDKLSVRDSQTVGVSPPSDLGDQ